MNFSTRIGAFCAQNPNDYQEKLSAPPYSLKIKTDDPYIIFNYNQLSSDFTNEIVREARGIIFRTGCWENPVCYAFDKFGNYGEAYVPEMDWSTAFVSEKVDGSLMKLWFDDGAWRVSTNGTIDAAKANTDEDRNIFFAQLFWDAFSRHVSDIPMFMESLDRSLTYVFELVSPYNRVVIPYAEPALYFLGARNKFDNTQYSCRVEDYQRLHMDVFNHPKLFPMTNLREVREAAAALPWDQEGFVVCDGKFDRCKIKSAKYVVAHFARSSLEIGRKHFLDVILQNELAEFLLYAPEQKEKIAQIQLLMKEFLAYLDAQANLARQNRSLDKRDFSKLVLGQPKVSQRIMFSNYGDDVSAQAYTKDWDMHKWDAQLQQYEHLLRT